MTLSQLVQQHGYGVVVRKTISKSNEPIRVVRLYGEGVFLVEGVHTDEEYTERGDVKGYEKMQSAAEKLAESLA